MNCQRFEEVVNDLAREEILDAGVRHEALDHSRECEHCTMRLADETAITIKLKSFAADSASSGAPARVEAELLKDFAAQRLNVPTVIARSQPRNWLRYGTAAVAALLLIVFTIALLRTRQVAVNKEVTSDRLAVTPTSSDPTSSPEDLRVPLVEPAVPPKRILFARRNRPSATSVTNQSKAPITNEVATDFIPVTYGGAANLADGGRMVRIELPRSAMSSFGLPFNMDRANEKVKADVLLGVDGLAHAIRFVR
jgi:hypothetical protein